MTSKSEKRAYFYALFSQIRIDFPTALTYDELKTPGGLRRAL
jgi:hypothetical protein